MIRLVVPGKDGRPIVMLGLTGENWKRMKDGDPVDVDTATLELTAVPSHIVIFGAEDENTVLEQFMAAGLLGPETKVTIDPRTIPDRAPVDVVDTAILKVPEKFRFDDPAAVSAQGAELQRELRGMAQKLIAEHQGLPPDVRKVEIQQLTWTITSSHDEMAAAELPHDCPKCRVGRADVVEWMIDNPGRWVAMGKLEYRMHFASA